MARKHVDVFRKDQILKQARDEVKKMWPETDADKLMDKKSYNKLIPKQRIKILKYDNESKHGGRQKQRRETGQHEFLYFDAMRAAKED